MSVIDGMETGMDKRSSAMARTLRMPRIERLLHVVAMAAAMIAFGASANAEPVVLVILAVCDA